MPDMPEETQPNYPGTTTATTDGADYRYVEALAERLREGLGQFIFGQDDVIDLLLVGLLSEGHVLIEGVPGTAKTTLVNVLAQLVQGEFRRVQLTPDMLPAEIIGTNVFDLNRREFSFQPGPVFTDLLLADEINRTPPKTQSALLESMEEHQVTVDGNSYPLSPLFTVFATLNPIEFEGTYPLPEAQLDRFLLKIKMDYPSKEAEKAMMESFAKSGGIRHYKKRAIEPVCSVDEILKARHALTTVTVESVMMDYLLDLVHDTRRNPALLMGCSPRSALSILSAVRAHAAIFGQDFVTPDNVKAIAPAVLRHRLILSAEAELDGLTPDDVVEQTLSRVAVPR